MYLHMQLTIMLELYISSSCCVSHHTARTVTETAHTGIHTCRENECILQNGVLIAFIIVIAGDYSLE